MENCTWNHVYSPFNPPEKEIVKLQVLKITCKKNKQWPVNICVLALQDFLGKIGSKLTHSFNCVLCHNKK